MTSSLYRRPTQPRNHAHVADTSLAVPRPVRQAAAEAGTPPPRLPPSGLASALEALEDRCVPSAAGSLDPTFGNGAGYVTTAAADGIARSVLIQPNGDIVAVGTGLNSSGSGNLFASSATTRMAAWIPRSARAAWSKRALARNRLIGASGALYPAGTANAGDIVEEGTYFLQGTNLQDLALARFNTNGTLDTTFGTGGEVMTAFPGMGSLQAICLRGSP